MKSLDQIARELQGYDPQALSAHAVLDFLERLVTPLADTESVSLFDAPGRVLAQDLISPLSVPPHDNAAMDGYAFSGAALRVDSALTLEAVGTALAGQAWRGTVGPGQCVKIMTGAIMPAGLDTVVPQEFVKLTEAQPHPRVTIPAGLLQAGDNRRHKGELSLIHI